MCEDVFSQTCATDTPTVAFETFSGEIKKKIKISEMSYYTSNYGYYYSSDYSSDYISDLYETFAESLEKEIENQIAVKGKISKIDRKGSVEEITSDGKAVYYMDNISDRHGDVYECKISGDNPKKPTLYDSDVYNYSFSILEDGTSMYFKNMKDIAEGELDGKTYGELYVNKKE